MKNKIERNSPLYRHGKKVIKMKMNRPEKEKKPEYKEPSEPLNKQIVEKHLSYEQREDIFENEYEPESDPDPIVIFDSELDSVEELKAVDIIFLVDTTASMNCYLKGIKKVMRKIIWDIEKCLSHFIIDEIDVLKVGLVTYKDHDDEDQLYLTNIDIDLNENLEEVINKIMGIKCSGGRDDPEAVLDGINVAVNDVSWREKSVKFIYHLLDAPCHGKKYNNKNDRFEECPNKLDAEDLLNEMRNKDIKYSVIKLNNAADLMLQEFQKFLNFELLSPKVYIDKSNFMLQE